MLPILTFIGIVAATFLGMEIASYILHRYVFHGLLWKIHVTHHTANHGLFELNDVFSLGFAGAAMWLIFLGANDPLGDYRFAIGIGITIYGVAYFIIHDLFTHRRFYPFKSENRAMQTIRRAHQRHHQSSEKDGFEPYGLFLFDYELFSKVRKKRGERG